MSREVEASEAKTHLPGCSMRWSMAKLLSSPSMDRPSLGTFPKHGFGRRRSIERSRTSRRSVNKPVILLSKKFSLGVTLVTGIDVLAS